jgi:hypothetical protein
MQKNRRSRLKHVVMASLILASSGLFASEVDFSQRQIQQKLGEIRLPANQLKGTSLRAAIEWLRTNAAAGDRSETDAARKGVNVVVVAPNAKYDQHISLNFPGGTLEEACLAVAEASRRSLSVDAGTITFAPIGMPQDLLLTRQFGKSSEPSVAAGSIRYGDMQLGTSVSAGITFPAGASLASTASSRLVMRNSQPDLATLEKLRRNP